MPAPARFFPWPNEALLDVATKFLEPYEMETDAKTKTALYGFVANIHSIVTDSTTEYFQRFRKAVYCTPAQTSGLHNCPPSFGYPLA